MTKSANTLEHTAASLTPREKDPLDVYVGKRLRRRRIFIGMSQTQLGEAVGVSFQQVQKYESGLNRAVPRRLFEFGRTLGVPLSYFFDGYAERHSGRGRSPERSEAVDVFGTDEALTLLRAYYRLRTPAVRQQLSRLIAVLSKE
jgi:transcriptional regulator with XRE-family HTH domain